MSYVCSHTFREWWRSLLDNYYNNFFWCVYFKALNDINVSCILLNDMIKNQEAVLYLDSPFIRDQHLSNLLPFFEFTWYVVTHFVQFSNTLRSNPIALNQVLQIWIICNDISRDNIWCNWEGLCWHYIFKKTLREFSLKLRGAALKSLTQLWCS